MEARRLMFNLSKSIKEGKTLRIQFKEWWVFIFGL